MHIYFFFVEREKLLRKVPIRWTWVKGHQGIEGNERADRLAELGREDWSVTSRASDRYMGRALFLMGSGQAL